MFDAPDTLQCAPTVFTYDDEQRSRRCAADDEEHSMALSTQDALIYLMVVTSTADSEVTAGELDRIAGLVERLPIFDGYTRDQLAEAAGDAVELTRQVDDLEQILDKALDVLPDRLHDTAYALAVEVAAVDLELGQEELRWLEMLRDRLKLDRLTTAAIEVAARARLRRA